MRAFYAFLIMLYFVGLVAVKGFWLTLLSIFVPPVSVYFAVEMLLKHFGIISSCLV